MRIKELSELIGVSKDAIYKQIKKYSKELDSHLSGRPLDLDDFAVEFIKAHSNGVKVIKAVIPDDVSVELNRLKEENSNLKNIIIQLQQNQLELEKKTLLLENRSFWQRVFNKK